MKRFIASLVILGMAGLMVGVAAAGTLDNAKAGLTLKPYNSFLACGAAKIPTGLACDAPNSSSNLIVQGVAFVPYSMYLVALDIDASVGLGGMALGISYPADWVVEWAKCCDQEFEGQGWPASGGGNTLTYAAATCPVGPDPSDPQGEATRVLGWFTLYALSDGVFEITKRNIAIPDFTAADCAASSSDPEFPTYAGKVGIGSGVGYQPCVPPEVVPTQTTTWGAIKKGLE
jgi:hypothetical protein